MLWEIPRCFDSHTHFLATGMMQKGLRLFDLHSPEDVVRLQVRPEHFRGDWLVGFGWDQSKWPCKDFPTREALDRVFPDFPVAFSRADGHALWLNSKALEIAGYLNQNEIEKPTPKGGLILRDSQGFPTGIFIELAKVEVDFLIPDYSKLQKRDFLLAAVQAFNSAGFTHIRDMTCNLAQWEILREMDLAGQLTLYVEENFVCENLTDFQRALAELQQARAAETPHLKATGIKFFFDGALGSQGAYLSQFYPGTQQRGLILWELDEVAEVIKDTWKSGFEVCVHTIGDEAAHLILKTALKVQEEQNLQGVLNIEHGEVVRPETLDLMQKLDVVCHLQPCHWLSDRRWLKEKLGELYSYVFPWAELQKRQISFQWGSDTPIEEPSVFNNFRALEESPREGIAPVQGFPLAAHSHRNPQWGADCHSVFKDGRPWSLCFDGRIISNSN
jgi:predicted amidohydrolase YtcJ